MGSICGGQGVVTIVDRTTSREILSHKLDMGSPIFIEQSENFFVDYKLNVETLELGPCSELRLCTNSSSNKLRAVKIVSKSCLPAVIINDKLVHTIINSIKKLNSPHVVKLYKLYESKDCYYVICEYLKTGSLSDSLEESLFSESRAKILAKHLLEISLSLAELKFFQYDLNPANVFLCESGVKVNLFSARCLLEDQCWLRSKKKKDDQSLEILKIVFFVLTGKILRSPQEISKENCWKVLSQECKAFFMFLLLPNQTLGKILEHPWVSGI